MLTLLIAIAAGILAGWGAFEPWGPVWGFICGLATVILVNLAAGLFLRRKVGAIQNAIQNGMTEAQTRLQRKLMTLQQRGSTNIKAQQQLVTQEQNKLIRESLKELERFKPYYPWSPMLKKQINTMAMAFYYQLKDFEMVDKLLKNCLFFDPHAVAMKLARMYKTGDPKLDKFFKKHARRLKGDACALVYGTYAWIKVRQDQVDKAVAALVQAKEKCDHPVIVENWERLVNGRVKHFSMTALGDSWYALALEEPRIRQQRVVRQY